MKRPMAATITRAVEHMRESRAGRIEIQASYANDRILWSVRGLGVDAGLYASPEKAFAAWEEAFDYLQRGAT